MEHNTLTFEALKAATEKLQAGITLFEHTVFTGMGNTILKTANGFLCAPEFMVKVQANPAAVLNEEITIVELSPTQPSDITTAPNFTMDQIKLWKL